MIEIAVADPSDATAFAALHTRCFAQGWSEDTFRQLLGTPNVLTLLAHGDSSEVLGFIVVRIAADESEILSLAVAPEYRSRGVGGKLVESSAHEASERGAHAMFLEVSVNNAAATHLYRKRGFKEAGRRRGYYQVCDSLADALVLRCELPIRTWESGCDSSNVSAERE